MMLPRALVSLDLIGLQHLVERLADRLDLDIAEDRAARLILKSGAPLSALRFGSCWTWMPWSRLRREHLQQRFERRAARVLGLLIEPASPRGLEIGVERAGHAHSRAGTWRGQSKEARSVNRQMRESSPRQLAPRSSAERPCRGFPSKTKASPRFNLKTRGHAPVHTRSRPRRGSAILPPWSPPPSAATA